MLDLKRNEGENSETAGAPRRLQANSKLIHVDLVIGDRAWVVEYIARQIADALPKDRFRCEIVLKHPSNLADITYFIPYSSQVPVEGSAVGSWFTHQEMIEPAKTRFVETAKAADFCLTPARRYEELLRDEGVTNVATILHGVDLERFTPSLRIGVVGRAYHTGRKGEDLIASILDLDFVELKFTGSGWPIPPVNYSDNELAEFYRSIDYLLIPSTIEGGPMPLFEALAAGCEVIASDVGCVPDFPHIAFRKGDGDDLRRVVKELRDKKLELRRSVEGLTWQKFGVAHARVFEEIYAQFGSNPKRQALDDSPGGGQNYILMTHGTEDKNKGGPTTRVSNIGKEATARGNAVSILHRSSPLGKDSLGADLIHVFNSWPLKTSVETLKDVRRVGCQAVFSPIALNLNHRPFFQDALPVYLETARTPEEMESVAQELMTLTQPWDPASNTAPQQGHDSHFAVLRTAMAQCDHAIYLSHYERAFLDLIGARAPSGTVVYNGVDTAQMALGDPSVFKRSFGLKDYILVVGRIETRKNQALVALALRDTKIPLVFIGHAGDPAYKHQVERWAGRVCIFIDRIDDRAMLASAYKGAKGLILASWSEGAPLVALEAAAAGTPLLLSNMSSEMEYFGEFADYTHPCDLPRIREWSLKALEAPETDEARAARSAFACQHFDISRHVNETLGVYSEVLLPHDDRESADLSRLGTFVIDNTHLAHDLHNRKTLTGVTTLERSLTEALIAQGGDRYRGSVCWNSPMNTYFALDFADAVAPDGDVSAANGTKIPAGAQTDRSLKVEVISTSDGKAKTRQIFSENKPMGLRRRMVTLSKHMLNGLPVPLNRAAIASIRAVRPTFNPTVEPQHYLFKSAAMKREIKEARKLELQPTSGLKMNISFDRHASGLTGLTADRVYVFGQPWISNDRQLDTMITSAKMNGYRLTPLIHDILYITDPGAFKDAQRQTYRRRLLKLLHASDAAIVTSESVKRALRQLCDTQGIELDIQRIRIGVSTDLLTTEAARSERPMPQHFIMYVSSMNARKQHSFIIDVWRDLFEEMVRNKNVPNYSLVLVGTAQAGFEHFDDAKYRAELAKSNIMILDNVDNPELAELYRRCKFTIYPSRSEGWGFPPIESLVFGKPCLVSNSIPSVQEIESGGMLKLSPDDFFGWRSTLRALLFQPTLCDAFAVRAAEFTAPDWSESALDLLGFDVQRH